MSDNGSVTEMKHMTFNTKAKKIWFSNTPHSTFFFSFWFWSFLPQPLWKTISTRLLIYSRCQEAGYRSGILVSAHLHPKGMAVFPQVTVWSLHACERDKMGEDINTARDGLHLSTVHRGLLISWPNCAPICWQKKKKKKDQLLHGAILISFFSSFFPLSIHA